MNPIEPAASEWHGCFDVRGWSGQVASESLSHPAKFAYGQIERIVRHGLEQGHWRPGDLIGDPFGGVGLGGIMAAYHGIRWLGVEVEPVYHAIGCDNFRMNRVRWETLGVPRPVIVLGDSRRLDEVLSQQGRAGWDAVITSPPYESVQLQQNAGYWERKFERYPELRNIQRPHGTNTLGAAPRYGWAEGQIGRFTGKRYRRMMTAVCSQTLAALRPGGVAAIVVRDYVRDGERVPFADQICELLRAIGFEIFQRTRCMMVKERRHPSLFGDEIVERREAKGFFRRLAEEHGAPPIDWEEVLWCRRSAVGIPA